MEWFTQSQVHPTRAPVYAKAMMDEGPVVRPLIWGQVAPTEAAKPSNYPNAPSTLSAC